MVTCWQYIALQMYTTARLWFARVDEDVTVKRLERKGEQVLLHAENEDFSTIKVDLASQPFNVEGIAVGVIRNADWMLYLPSVLSMGRQALPLSSISISL